MTNTLRTDAVGKCNWPCGDALGTVSPPIGYTSQPIVENYVGRQVPTAMVARNLDRGSAFLRPLLDTAPFPNYFLVEPPVYELAVVAVRRIAGWRLEACGRIVSALRNGLGRLGIVRTDHGGERSRGSPSRP